MGTVDRNCRLTVGVLCTAEGHSIQRPRWTQNVSTPLLVLMSTPSPAIFPGVGFGPVKVKASFQLTHSFCCEGGRTNRSPRCIDPKTMYPPISTRRIWFSMLPYHTLVYVTRFPRKMVQGVYDVVARTRFGPSATPTTLNSAGPGAGIAVPLLSVVRPRSIQREKQKCD